jgi:WD40 repeat protein/regulator of sirC expression with transglutaminase-like and TPR domain
MLASGDRRGHVKVWDLPTDRQPDLLREHSGRPLGSVGEQRHFAFSPKSGRLAIAGPNDAIKLLDPATGQEHATLGGHPGPLGAIAFSRDGRLLAVVTNPPGKGGTVRIWDVAASRTLADLQGHSAPITCLAFSPDGAALATGGADHAVKLWDTASGKERRTLGELKSVVTCIAFAPDGKALAAARSSTSLNENAEVRVWDTASGEVRALFTWRQRMVHIWCVAFQGVNTLLVGGGNRFNPLAAEVKLLDVGRRQEITSLRGHVGLVRSLAFSEDGTTLATTGSDGRAKLWDTQSWEERLTLEWEEHPLSCVVFSPDGRTLATGDENGQIRLWRGATDDVVAQSAKRAAAWEWTVFRDRGLDHLGSQARGGAVEQFSKAIELKPDEASLWHMRARAYCEQKQFDKALADCSKAIELDPTLAVAWGNRGGAYDELKQYGKAIADHSKAIELDPTCAAAWQNRGSAYRELMQYEKALADHSKAIELDPTLVAAWGNRGVAYLWLKQYEKALPDFSKAIELDPKDALAWGNRGLAYYELKQYGKAIADSSKAVELDPTNAVAWSNRGLAYYELKQFEKAAADLTQAAEAASDEPSALNNLAWLFATGPEQLRDGPRALELAKKAVKARPDSPEYLNTMGVIYYRLGQYEQGVETLSKAVQANKQGGTACDYFFLAMAHWQLGHKDEARKGYDQAAQWMEKNKPQGTLLEEFGRFRTEAEELMGIKNKEGR